MRRVVGSAVGIDTPRITALRRRLLHLSVRLWWHPYWQSAPSVPAARSALRQAVCAQRAGWAA
ncbi:hypothetical protein [Streptomyces sp. B27]|uniref:hypothetical protein n=1 Tax=Streptomyces sp. B27 TaxID=2485015 RepID=UPI001F0C9A75|nr:hypothetical protein [Streptomyces sp. B27]